MKKLFTLILLFAFSLFQPAQAKTQEVDLGYPKFEQMADSQCSQGVMSVFTITTNPLEAINLQVVDTNKNLDKSKFLHVEGKTTTYALSRRRFNRTAKQAPKYLFVPEFRVNLI